MSEILKSVISGNELKPGVSFIDADTVVQDGQKLSSPRIRCS